MIIILFIKKLVEICIEYCIYVMSKVGVALSPGTSTETLEYCRGNRYGYFNDS